MQIYKFQGSFFDLYNFCRLQEKKKQLNRNLIHYFENYSRVKLEPTLGQLVEQEKNLEMDLDLSLIYIFINKNRYIMYTYPYFIHLLKLSFEQS